MAEIPSIRKLRLRNKIQNLILNKLETQRNSVQQPCSNFDQTTVIEAFRSNSPSPPPQYQPMQNISNQFRTPRTDQDDQHLLLYGDNVDTEPTTLASFVRSFK